MHLPTPCSMVKHMLHPCMYSEHLNDQLIKFNKWIPIFSMMLYPQRDPEFVWSCLKNVRIDNIKKKHAVIQPPQTETALQINDGANSPFFFFFFLCGGVCVAFKISHRISSITVIHYSQRGESEKIRNFCLPNQALLLSGWLLCQIRELSDQ